MAMFNKTGADNPAKSGNSTPHPDGHVVTTGSEAPVPTGADKQREARLAQTDQQWRMFCVTQAKDMSAGKAWTPQDVHQMVTLLYTFISSMPASRP